jgi:hypothetical protein
MKIDCRGIQKVLDIFKQPNLYKKRVMLIRHGESEGNVTNIYYGSTDLPLTETGIFQANILQEVLRPYIPLFEGIKSSNLIRALETCKGCVDLQASNIVSDFKNKSIGLTNNSWGVYPEAPEVSLQGEYLKSPDFVRVPSIQTPSIEQIRVMQESGLRAYLELLDLPISTEIKYANNLLEVLAFLWTKDYKSLI